MAFLLNLESSESVNHTLCDFDFQLYGNLYAKICFSALLGQASFFQQETPSAEQASLRGSYRHLNRMNCYRHYFAISSRKIGRPESLSLASTVDQFESQLWMKQPFTRLSAINAILCQLQYYIFFNDARILSNFQSFIIWYVQLRQVLNDHIKCTSDKKIASQILQ